MSSSSKTQQQISRLTNAIDNAQRAVQQNMADSREKAIVMTKLEEAWLWAKEGVKRNG